MTKNNKKYLKHRKNVYNKDYNTNNENVHRKKQEIERLYRILEDAKTIDIIRNNIYNEEYM